MNDKTEYYYTNGGERLGPVTTEALTEMLKGGLISGDTLVWRNGMSEWASLASSDLGYLVMPAERRDASLAAPFGSGGPAPGVSFLDAVKICLSKYVTFRGRASRSEY